MTSSIVSLLKTVPWIKSLFSKGIGPLPPKSSGINSSILSSIDKKSTAPVISSPAASTTASIVRASPMRHLYDALLTRYFSKYE